MREYQSYAYGEWLSGKGGESPLVHSVTGEVIGTASSRGLIFKDMLTYARSVGGPNLRKLSFHERARRLKRLAQYLMARKEEFYKVSSATGATKGDSWIDIEGGIGTFFIYASKGRREFPDDTFYLDGPTEQISKEGTFLGRHICVPMEGVAVHINAFNFPVWGMLEKLAPTFLAGMPAIVKPATVTCYLTEVVVRAILDSKILPEGALQLICGSAGDIFDHLTCQDVVTFTGSAATGQKLRSHKSIVEQSIRFNMEADSLNCSILGSDVEPSDEEFDLFIKEVAREITVKAGQKCTAIRRTLVPARLLEPVVAGIKKRLAGVVVGDPSAEGVRMGPLVSRAQVQEVGERVSELKSAGELAFGGTSDLKIVGADPSKGAFFAPTLLVCNRPKDFSQPHDVEAFGPVTTVMPYSSDGEAIELAAKGKGSLVGSLFTKDLAVARRVVMGLAPYHGRIVVIDRASAKESTGHGSPLPHLTHGGPGRAGGGEEMGGKRAVLHYMQRSAIQGSPTVLSVVGNEWVRGGEIKEDRIHPFRKHFEEIDIGDSLITHRRTMTEADIVGFAGISGDFFYAHMDDIAARESLFEKRVVHGYFVLAAAAGLFVDPAPGPVLANYGLDNLRFVKPVYVGDTIQVRLTCKQKMLKETPVIEGKPRIPQGVVAWDVEVWNQSRETVASYTILTLVKCKVDQFAPPADAVSVQ